MNTKDTLEVAPAKIAEGQWVVRSAHLIGSDQVCPDELSAKRMAKFAEACIKAARAKDAELIQRLVDALAREDSACPNNCINGAIPTMPDGEPEQCQWCWTYGYRSDALEQAAAQGVKPSDQ